MRIYKNDSAKFREDALKDKSINEQCVTNWKESSAFQEAALSDKDIYAEFVKRWVADENKPLDFSDLEYAFTDYEGKRYYAFKSLHMPPVREAVKNEFIIWLAKGLTGEQEDEIIELMDEALADGLNTLVNKKFINATRIGACIAELKMRRGVDNVEVIYNLLAIGVVREDESPCTFDSEKHEAKVQQFLKDAEGENRFFFRMIELSRYLESLSISEESWTSTLDAYKAIQKRHEHVLETLSSSKELDLTESPK